MTTPKNMTLAQLLHKYAAPPTDQLIDDPTQIVEQTPPVTAVATPPVVMEPGDFQAPSRMGNIFFDTANQPNAKNPQGVWDVLSDPRMNEAWYQNLHRGDPRTTQHLPSAQDFGDSMIDLRKRMAAAGFGRFDEQGQYIADLDPRYHNQMGKSQAEVTDSFNRTQASKNAFLEAQRPKEYSNAGYAAYLKNPKNFVQDSPLAKYYAMRKNYEDNMSEYQQKVKDVGVDSASGTVMDTKKYKEFMQAEAILKQMERIAAIKDMSPEQLQHLNDLRMGVNYMKKQFGKAGARTTGMMNVDLNADKVIKAREDAAARASGKADPTKKTTEEDKVAPAAGAGAPATQTPAGTGGVKAKDPLTTIPTTKEELEEQRRAWQEKQIVDRTGYKPPVYEDIPAEDATHGTGDAVWTGVKNAGKWVVDQFQKPRVQPGMLPQEAAAYSNFLQEQHKKLLEPVRVMPLNTLDDASNFIKTYTQLQNSAAFLKDSPYTKVMDAKLEKAKQILASQPKTAPAPLPQAAPGTNIPPTTKYDLNNKFTPK